MRRRRSARGKVRFNKNLIIDTIGASLIVQKVPALIQKLTGADVTTGMIGNVAGAGAGYLVGMFLKRPDIANVSIALAVSDVASGVVDTALNSIGVGTGNTSLPPSTTKNPKTTPVSDYLSLNDYTNNPSARMGYDMYRFAYN